MSNKIIRRLIKRILLLFLGIALTKNILWDYYKVSSESMLPTIVTGDYIFTNVLTYRFGLGAYRRSPQKTPRFITFWKVSKGDIVIFNKPNWKYSADQREFYGPEYVKRCVGEPGDTVFIDRPEQDMGYRSRVPGKYNVTIFPHDSSFKWTVNKMGPIWVPKKGSTLVLDSNNIKLYQTVLRFEGLSSSPKSMEPMLHTVYHFKNDYYFFLGDNFYESEDSRYWGFVPRMNLLGKVILKI